jgi:hypothetical protein
MKNYHDLAYEELKQLHTDIGHLLEDKKVEVLASSIHQSS